MLLCLRAYLKESKQLRQLLGGRTNNVLQSMEKDASRTSVNQPIKAAGCQARRQTAGRTMLAIVHAQQVSTCICSVLGVRCSTSSAPTGVCA